MNNIIKRPTPDLSVTRIDRLPENAPIVKNLITPTSSIVIPDITTSNNNSSINYQSMDYNNLSYSTINIPYVNNNIGLTGTTFLNTIGDTMFNPTTSYFNIDNSNINNLTVKNLFAQNISMTGPTGTFINNNNTILNNLSVLNILVTGPSGITGSFINNGNSILNKLTVESGDITLIDEVGTHQLQSIDGNLYYDAELLARATDILDIAEWSLYPAFNNVDMKENNLFNVNSVVFKGVGGITGITGPSGATGITGPTGGILTTDGSNNLIYNGQIINTGTGGNVANWSTYPAISNVNLNDHNIVSNNAINLNSTYGNINLNAGFTGIFKQNVEANAGTINLTADLGASLGFNSAINLVGQNGTRGQISLDAKAGNAGLGGVINILAEGGELDGVGYGGLITLDATSAVLTGLSSAIKLSASGINSYAGATSVGSVLGYNFVYGKGGVNITASVLLPSTNLPLTVYLYGDNGVVVGSSLYVYNQITNYYNGISSPSPLNITGRTVATVDYPVNLDIVGSIGFSSQQSGQINGCKSFSGNNTTMSGISTITTGTINSTGNATLQTVTTNNINSATANSLALNGVSLIGGNAISINSGGGTVTVQGNATDLISTNTNITKANITTLNATTINGVSGVNVIEPCKSLNGSFGVVALTIAPIVIFQSSNLTWNFNGISKLGSGISVTVGVDTVASYAFSCQILYNSITYPFNTFTLSAPCVANSGIYNGVNIVTATFNDSFNNVIPDGSTYKILIYMSCGSVSSANTTGGRVAINFINGQNL